MGRVRLGSVVALAFLVLSCRAASVGQVAGDRGSIVAKDGMEYVWIPPGGYQMGCVPTDSECDAREKPRHPVTIGRGFWLGRTEVAVAAYRRFAAATGRPMPTAPDFNQGWLHDTHPMVKVTWHDATAYCGWTEGRLPTEAEWEYAARAGRETKYPWGDTISHYGGGFRCAVDPSP